MTMKKSFSFAILLSILFLCLLCACTAQEPITQEDPVQEEITPPQPIKLTLVAVGDNLIHNTLSFDSKTAEGYDFYPIYEAIAPKILSADLAIVNQEVPLNGEVGAYPYLAAPQEVATALKQAGFNGVTLANNHTNDQGAEGIVQTIEAFENEGFAAIAGATKDPANMDCGAVIELQGAKIGLLSYTYGLNTSSKGGYVNIIEKERIQKDVQALQEECSFIIVAMHWGNEYQTTPSAYQKEYAQFLADLGVNLILGHHPHVVQPCEWLTGEGGNRTLCAYSLGNFVSNQHKLDTMLGGLLTLELTFSPEGTFQDITAVDYSGVVTHFSTKSRDFAIYPLEEYTEDLAKEHGLKKFDIIVTKEYFDDTFASILY